ncbi:MAG: stage sporulation protein [Clostridia bacterium]|nr:stage sporulation protein [Clostridia bacterium]
MGRLVKLGIKGYFINNYFVYLFLILFLIMGIVFGVLGVKALTPVQLENLNQYIDTGFKAMGNEIDYQSTAKHAIWRNLITIFKIWFLGLTVIGLPLIIVIIFTRGFVLGFTVGFFLENNTWQGLGIILLTIFPQNLLQLPSLIIASASATAFSLYLLNGRRIENRAIPKYFFKYTLVLLILAVIMILAGFIEGYLTPLATKVFKF